MLFQYVLLSVTQLKTLLQKSISIDCRCAYSPLVSGAITEIKHSRLIDATTFSAYRSTRSMRLR